MLSHCISNRLKRPFLNSYLDNLAIHHPDLGGNDVIHNFNSIRRWVLLGPSTLPRFRECFCSSVFLFYTVCHSQNIVQWKKGILCFRLFSSDYSLALNSLSNHLKFTFSTNSLLICLLPFLRTCTIIECISSFPKQIFTNILSIIS